MNTEQKDRLLKLAENNPDLAKDVVDILKADSDKSDAPVAVKVVKDEADKIEITEEQKKWAIGYLVSVIVAGLSILFLVLTLAICMPSVKTAYAYAPVSFIWVLLCILSSWLCAYKAGMPTIKSFCAKHFKFT